VRSSSAQDGVLRSEAQLGLELVRHLWLFTDPRVKFPAAWLSAAFSAA
jgi:hypothetical protein